MPALLEKTDTDVDVIRAWVDVDYRSTLTDVQLAALPDSPVGDLHAIDTGEIVAGESAVISFLSPAGCWFTLACTSPCCAW